MQLQTAANFHFYNGGAAANLEAAAQILFSLSCKAVLAAATTKFNFCQILAAIKRKGEEFLLLPKISF